MTRIFRGYVAPNPKEFDYWVDLSVDPKGNYIKYYAGNSQWKHLNDDTDNAQDAVIDELTTKVNTLQSEVNTLKSKVAALEAA